MRLRGQLNPGEYVIVATRQHPGALLPSLTCLLLGIAAAAFASTARSSVILWWVGTIAAVAFFIGALRIGWRWLTTGYLITTHRLVVRRGLVTRTGEEASERRQRWRQRAQGATSRGGQAPGVRGLVEQHVDLGSGSSGPARRTRQDGR